MKVLVAVAVEAVAILVLQVKEVLVVQMVVEAVVPLLRAHRGIVH